MSEKKSKGQLFKERTGYSKTRKNLMIKHDVTSIEDYRVLVRRRKKDEAALSKKKRDAAKAGRKEKAVKKKK